MAALPFPFINARVYCDSSFNEKGVSFIGCVAVRDGVEICQSTARVMPDPLRNIECELAAIDFGIAIAALFPDPRTIITTTRPRR